MVTSAKAKSVKTTAGGIVVALGLIFSAIGKMINGEPVGMEEMALIVAAIGAVWQGWSARDDDVTSEGIKRPKTQHVSNGRIVGALLPFLVLVLFIPACSTPRGFAPTDEVSPLVTLVAADVEAYVAADNDLTDEQREARLDVTSAAREAVADETVDTREPSTVATMETLASLHEQYVQEDPALDLWQKEQRSRSSEILRRLFGVEQIE